MKGGAMARQFASEVAQKHGEKLPAFSDRQAAEHYWFTFRDKHLALLSQMAQEHREFALDYAPPSLLQLEQWYFNLYENDTFESIGITREAFEICMAMYFGETAVRSTGAQWIVEEYYLVPGKYELGIRRERLTMMLDRFSDHFRAPNNKKKQNLFRRYELYFPALTKP
jgi:hypothetical protein